MRHLLESYAKIPRGKRLFTVFLIALSAAIIYFTIFHQNQQDTIKTLESRLRKNISAKKQKEKHLKELNKFETRYIELQNKINYAKSVLPDSDDIPQLLSLLGKKAKQSGLMIDKFAPTTETNVGFYNEIEFLIELSGSYHEIATFFDAIGKMNRIVNVSGINLTNPRTVKQKIILNGKFKIKTYRFLSDTAEEKTQSSLIRKEDIKND